MKNWIAGKTKRIRTRFFLAIVTVCFAVMSVISISFYIEFEWTLQDRILLQLSSVRHLKQYQVENFIVREFDAFEKAVRKGDTSEFVFNPDSSWIYTHFKALPVEFEIDGIHDWTAYSKDQALSLGFVKKTEAGLCIKLLEGEVVTPILQERTGMGRTGETYLVGSDGRLRSVSRFFPETPYYTIKCNTYGYQKGMLGENGSSVYPDYRGINVFGSYEQINLRGVRWVILSEIDEAEVYEPLTQLRLVLTLIFFAMLVIVIGLSFWVSNALVSPIRKMRGFLSEMAKGKVVPPSEESYKSLEFQEMFEALNKLIASLNEAVTFAKAVGSGEFDKGYMLLGPDDTLGKALIQMRDDLVSFRKKEEEYKIGIQRSILQGQEDERKRLSRELHDGLGPLLTSLRMNVSMANLETGEKEHIKKQIDETITEVRRMTADLMPQALIDFGVGAALGSWLDSIRKATPIEIIYKNDLPENSRLHSQIHIELYRIAQESINNALKHAQASQIKISLTEFDDRISYYLVDNGKGYDTSKKYPGNGLLNMQERVRLLHGSIYIESTEKGTSLEVEIPIA